MARPAYRGDDTTARDKLVDAFWASLEEGTLPKLTVSGICKRTGLNRNSFYYHFDSMEDLARAAVKDTLQEDLPSLMISQAGGGAAAVAQMLDRGEFSQQSRRVRLMAGPNSTPELQSMLRSAIRSIWCSTLGIDPDQLPGEKRMILEFCLGGVISLLASRCDAEPGITMSEMLKTDFARTILASMSDLATPEPQKSQSPAEVNRNAQ